MAGSLLIAAVLRCAVLCCATTCLSFVAVDPRGTKEFRKKKSLMDIHTVEVDPTNPKAFFMYAYKSKAKFASVKVPHPIQPCMPTFFRRSSSITVL
jgi:hypothetical protein